jgi:hypothetical protein
MPQLLHFKSVFLVAEYNIMGSDERFDVCKIHWAANHAIRWAKATRK